MFDCIIFRKPFRHAEALAPGVQYHEIRYKTAVSGAFAEYL